MLDQSFSFRSVLVVVIYLILILQQNFTATPGADFLDEILTRVLFLFLQTRATYYSFFKGVRRKT
jgi:hypothetical protein